MEALLALVEDSAALIDRTGLHDPILHFVVVALGTSFLDYHLGLASLLFHLLSLVLMQPVLVLPDQ